MGRPTKEKSLSQKDIIATAIKLVKDEGEAALGVNRVARELGITPPSIYKHLESGSALRRLVALEIWRRFLEFCCDRVKDEVEPAKMLINVAHAARSFARSHPALFAVMIEMQLHPTDSDCNPILKSILGFYEKVLKPYNFTIIERTHAMRMLNSAFYGFVAVEKAGLMTLEVSTEASYDVIIKALIKAIQYIRD